MPTTPATAETDSVPMAKQAFYETKRFRQNIPLFLMLVPGILYYVIFRYFPMGGLVIAFKDYNFRDGILSSPWVGLKYFKILFQSDATLQIIWNTLSLSILNLIFGFPAPIIIAIALNEVRKRWLKRWIQTIFYLPSRPRPIFLNNKKPHRIVACNNWGAVHLQSPFLLRMNKIREINLVCRVL